jgi:hypothetical protein
MRNDWIAMVCRCMPVSTSFCTLARVTKKMVCNQLGFTAFTATLLKAALQNESSF